MLKGKTKKKEQTAPPLLIADGDPCCCPQKKKPISISFDGLVGESGTTLNPESYYHAIISVGFRISKSVAEKYIDKQLSIKDLNDMIKCRK